MHLLSVYPSKVMQVDLTFLWPVLFWLLAFRKSHQLIDLGGGINTKRLSFGFRANDWLAYIKLIGSSGYFVKIDGFFARIGCFDQMGLPSMFPSSLLCQSIEISLFTNLIISLHCLLHHVDKLFGAPSLKYAEIKIYLTQLSSNLFHPL